MAQRALRDYVSFWVFKAHLEVDSFWPADCQAFQKDWPGSASTKFVDRELPAAVAVQSFDENLCNDESVEPDHSDNKCNIGLASKLQREVRTKSIFYFKVACYVRIASVIKQSNGFIK